MKCIRRAEHGRGVALLEVLVAVAIAGSALAVLLQTVTQALIAEQVAQSNFAATSALRSLLGDLGASIPVRAGRQAGVIDDSLRWEISMSADPPSGRMAGPASATWALYQVDITITWDRSGRVGRLWATTERLARRRNGQ